MLNQRDFADRQIIAAVREYNDLLRRRHTIIKLDHPIQRGWRRSYVLSERAKQRRDRPLLEAILMVINTAVVHHNRSFRKRRGRSKKLVEVEQPLRPIPVHEWERKHYPAEWFRHFRRELLLEWNRHWQPYWVFTQPSLFELKIERNWLWHLRVIHPAIEKRLSELGRWLESRDGWCRHGWLKGQAQSYHWKETLEGRERFLCREHQREIRAIMKHIPEVDPASAMRRSPISLLIISSPA